MVGVSRTGLGRYGVVPSTVVREPARNHDGIVVCPECGRPVANSKGTPRIHNPSIVETELLDAVDRLVTFGWQCQRHQYTVVLPARIGGSDAAALGDGWTGVRIVFVDQSIRHVPVPKKEVNGRVE